MDWLHERGSGQARLWGSRAVGEETEKVAFKKQLQNSSRANQGQLLFLAPAWLPISLAKLKIGLEPSHSQH